MFEDLNNALWKRQKITNVPGTDFALHVVRKPLANFYAGLYMELVKVPSRFHSGGHQMVSPPTPEQATGFNKAGELLFGRFSLERARELFVAEKNPHLLSPCSRQEWEVQIGVFNYTSNRFSKHLTMYHTAALDTPVAFAEHKAGAHALCMDVMPASEWEKWGSTVVKRHIIRGRIAGNLYRRPRIYDYDIGEVFEPVRPAYNETRRIEIMSTLSANQTLTCYMPDEEVGHVVRTCPEVWA